MKMKDTPLALKDWQEGMSLEEIAKKYELNDKNHAAIAVQSGHNYLKMKGVKPSDPEGTG